MTNKSTQSHQFEKIIKTAVKPIELPTTLTKLNKRTTGMASSRTYTPAKVADVTKLLLLKKRRAVHQFLFNRPIFPEITHRYAGSPEVPSKGNLGGCWCNTFTCRMSLPSPN